ncbi:MAG: glycyl-radical enzyme activating protein [Ignavibacteria bacterium]
MEKPFRMKLSGGQNITSDCALIFDVQDLSVQDGPGIRTTVFMKGCPLKCKWCANPEGQNPHVEFMHINSLCGKNYKCVSVCPYSSASAGNGYPEFNHSICNDCVTHECVDHCPTQSVKFTGRYLSVDDLIKRIKPNLSYYKNSGGGITFSGGEPFLQTGFISNFIEKTSPLGLSVGVETCGMFAWEDVEKIAAKFDFIYFDLKCMDSGIHKSVTGSPNETILNNLKNLAMINTQNITVSVPVIPEVNDFYEQIKSIAGFCKDVDIKRIRLLPYHFLGESKYANLGRKYLMEKDLSVSQETLESLKKTVEVYGIICSIE